MDELAQPVRIFFVPELVKGTGQNGTAKGWQYQEFFVDFFREYRENWMYELSKFDVNMSSSIDSNSNVICLKIVFYDMDKYMEFCLTWM